MRRWLTEKHRLGGLVLGLLIATLPMAFAAEVQQGEAVFYPPSPDAPRIQHLLTLSGERDLVASRGGLAAFVLGEEQLGRQLAQPYGVAVYEGRIHVADTGAAGIAVFDLTGKSMSFFHGAGSGRLKRPINIRIDQDGTRYVTDTLRDQVVVFDRNDRYLNAIGSAKEFRPIDVAIAADRLYVTDLKNHQVHVIDKRTGKTLLKFGKAGSGDGELFHPTNIALGDNGDVYVVDTSNYRIQRFSAEGVFIKSYGAVGNAPGSFARPKGIAIDRAGRMYVGDAAFENIQMFDRQGSLLTYFGQRAEPFDGLNLPAGMAIDYSSVSLFAKYAHPDFAIEYLILVASQFGPNKIDIFGFGKMKGLDYPADDAAKAITQ